MKNSEIINIAKQELDVVKVIASSVCQIKDEDVKAKIDYVLKYLDCDAYNDQARSGFRIFAQKLKELINEDSK